MDMVLFALDYKSEFLDFLKFKFFDFKKSSTSLKGAKWAKPFSSKK